jgi:ankyrin repeat protein
MSPESISTNREDIAMEGEVSEVRKALYRGDRHAAEALVTGGAALNVFDAAAFGDTDRVPALLTENPSLVHAWSADGFTALHFAAYLGGAEPVRVLLEAGSDATAVARNDTQVQPLHSAAALGDVDAVRLLLDAGADPNAAQHGGWTPLDEAVITKNESLAELLREHGGRGSGSPLPA